MAFHDLFTAPKPLIACIHLLPLPGSPRYAGSMRAVYDTALAEARLFTRYRIDGLIVGSYFKYDGRADNLVEEARVQAFTEALQALRH